VVVRFHDGADEILNHQGHEGSRRLLASDSSFVPLVALVANDFAKCTTTGFGHIAQQEANPSRRDFVQACQRVGAPAHQQHQGDCLRIRLRLSLFPFFQRPFVDAQSAREQRSFFRLSPLKPKQGLSGLPDDFCEIPPRVGSVVGVLRLRLFFTS
jgi:hypothetical protein